MAEINPYATTAAVSEDLGAETPVTPQRLWMGFLAAPLVPPLLITLLYVVFGAMTLGRYGTNGPGTQVGLIMFPLVMMTMGALLSYATTLVLGMPILFWLYRKRTLSGWTIHLTAILVVIVFSALVTIGSQILEGFRDPGEIGYMMVGMPILLTPFVLPAGTTFWWIAFRGRTLPARENGSTIE